MFFRQISNNYTLNIIHLAIFNFELKMNTDTIIYFYVPSTCMLLSVGHMYMYLPYILIHVQPLNKVCMFTITNLDSGLVNKRNRVLRKLLLKGYSSMWSTNKPSKIKKKFIKYMYIVDIVLNISLMISKLM